ncbi:hypothetical protein MUK42_19849 [Musa troglodytarum]|uniref:GIL1/IRKI C-terminal domain-containing protein n=1 Tax=Musa troglodytarum TaxID=320322 RepID=A0A9E7G8J9_9LILI|nr:hypothetical protein MUK42_19849 [Musa troglodytarum]
MASPFSCPSSFSLPSPPPLPPRSPVFAPIPEHEKEEEEDESQEVVPKEQPSSAAVSGSPYVHNPTPLHSSVTASSAATSVPTATPRRPSRCRGQEESVVVSVSCNKCRPTSRDKLITVVPLDNAAGQHQTPTVSSSPSLRGLRSLFFSLTRRSPAAASATPVSDVHEDQWRLAAAELSRKLVHATRKRDEALLEASRLKYSLAELERKVERLESHCRCLGAALQPDPATGLPPSAPFTAEAFHLAVADAHTAVRHLARSLISQIRLAGPGSRSSDRVATLIQPYDPRAAVQWRRNPSGLLFYMEALLNRVLYAGFEEDDEEESALIDPAARCEASRTSYETVRGLGWDEVLSKGTRHYSVGLSRFCDRKMSEVVAMVGRARPWPEGLLQAFFGAAKGAWVVRLMARSVHPATPTLRANRGARFDGRFMEDVAADRVKRLTPVGVRMMVAPGFHVYTGGVVKCKVLCVYNSGNTECSNDSSSGTNTSERPQQQKRQEM